LKVFALLKRCTGYDIFGALVTEILVFFFYRLKQSVPYGSLIEKEECANRGAKNFTNYLHGLVKSPFMAKNSLEEQAV
jgi:hypothetical protein